MRQMQEGGDNQGQERLSEVASGLKALELNCSHPLKKNESFPCN
jgi:hypothetical protein